MVEGDEPIISQPSKGLNPRTGIHLDPRIPPRQRRRLPPPLVLSPRLGLLDVLSIRLAVPLVELLDPRRLGLDGPDRGRGCLELGELDVDLGEEGVVAVLAGKVALDEKARFALGGVDALFGQGGGKVGLEGRGGAEE